MVNFNHLHGFYYEFINYIVCHSPQLAIASHSQLIQPSLKSKENSHHFFLSKNSLIVTSITVNLQIYKSCKQHTLQQPWVLSRILKEKDDKLRQNPWKNLKNMIFVKSYFGCFYVLFILCLQGTTAMLICFDSSQVRLEAKRIQETRG